MARIQVFQGGTVQREASQVTPFRAPDFGPGIGAGVEKFGQALGETAQKVNEIQDVDARIEANKLTIAYNNLQQQISQRVRSVLGEGAVAAAEKGTADLEAETQKLLADANPRTRHILEPMFAERTTNAKGEFWSYGFEQNKQAYDTSSQAANDRDLEAAGHTDDDKAAKPYLDSIAVRNHQRAQFFGYGPDWETQENFKSVSAYHRGRALSIGVNSASDAIKYAVANRNNLSDDDFGSILRAYREQSIDEQSDVEADRYENRFSTRPESATVTETTEDDTVKRADPKMVFNGLMIPNEGTRLKIDNNGALVKYGINQKENPDVDVKSLTLAGAQNRFITKYWNAVGADKLPPALAVVAADTAYVAGVGKAKALLAESGGDVDRLMELRDNFLASLHAKDPAKYPDYSARNDRVAKYASWLGGDGSMRPVGGPITATTSLTPIFDDIDARTDIPVALKEKIKAKLRERRELLRSDKRDDEDDARDTLITSMTKLGDKFTSVKQLPPDALTRASPEVIASLTKAARSNMFKKEDAALLPDVNYTQFTDPQKFMSKQYVVDLMKHGASPALIKHVEDKQAEILQRQMNAKPSVTQDKTLWEVAKPAFAAAGIAVNTPIKTITGKKQAVAQEQLQATSFLQNLATTWEQQHPGERPTPQIMNQWVGAALLNANGKRLYQANDADVFNSLPENIRGTIIRGLRRHGYNGHGPDLVAHVANAYRQLRALYGTGPITFNPDDSVNAAPLRGVTNLPDLGGVGAIDMSDTDYSDDQ